VLSPRTLSRLATAVMLAGAVLVLAGWYSLPLRTTGVVLALAGLGMDWRARHPGP
jgi:hypothetical protein